MTQPPPETLSLPVDNTELDSDITRAIEAVVMVSEAPVPPALLAQLCEISEELVEAHCGVLIEQYETADRGFILARVAGGFRYQSHPDLAPYVERYVLDGQSSRLSAAALETLAIVAYKQPISRAQVAAIRGVNVDAVMRTLDQRGYIAEIARDPGPGQAVLFGTTQLFLEKVGIDSLDDLPALGDFVPGADIVEQLEAGLRVDETDDEMGILADAEGAEDEAAPPSPIADTDAVTGEPGADSVEAVEADATGPIDLTDTSDEQASHPGQTEAVVIEMPDRSGRFD